MKVPIHVGLAGFGTPQKSHCKQQSSKIENRAARPIHRPTAHFDKKSPSKFYPVVVKIDKGRVSPAFLHHYSRRRAVRACC